MSDLALACNCCLARMLSGEGGGGVGMNRSARGEQSVKRIERSNGPDMRTYTHTHNIKDTQKHTPTSLLLI